MEIYHILTRGTEKRKIFQDEKDNFRFVHDLYEFNDEEPVNSSLTFSRKCYDVSRPNIGAEEGESRRKRKLLVTIHAFAIMPNHYHLLLSPLSERAVFFFMKKLNGGYARYFNQKYERKGRLFQSAFKSILVEHESHFIHLPYYIHCNRLDAAFPGWRKRELDNPTAAIGHLNKDRWSSHKDFMGEKNFPSVTQRDFLLEYFGGTEGYKENMKSWLESFSENKIGGLNLE